MRVVLDKVSKRYGAQRVLEDAQLTLEPKTTTGITGPNGSGKSTLLKIIAGALIPDSGSVSHFLNGTMLKEEEVFRQVSIAAPYLNLYDDLSLGQSFDAHRKFKPLREDIGADGFFERVLLSDARKKSVRELSSGMLQRLKLGLAILSDTPLLLLDEPGSNLDAAGLAWYHDLLKEHGSERTILICSNREQEELKVCDEVLNVTELGSQLPREAHLGAE